MSIEEVQKKFDSFLERNVGSFSDKLFDLIIHAPNEERVNLASIYPYHVQVVILYFNSKGVSNVSDV